MDRDVRRMVTFDDLHCPTRFLQGFARSVKNYLVNCFRILPLMPADLVFAALRVLFRKAL